jgi:hypothetical protein
MQIQSLVGLAILRGSHLLPDILRYSQIFISVDIQLYYVSVELKEPMRKFLQTVGDNTWKDLVREAKARDISVQELIRAIIIPEWMKKA